MEDVRTIVIVVAYTPEEHEKIFAISEDRDQVSMDWAQWRQAADEKKAEAAMQGSEYVEQYIDALGLVTYCLGREIPINARARADYAHILYERQRRESIISSGHSEEEEHAKLPTHSYTPPVDKLLTYASIKAEKPLPDISYTEKFGIGPEHIPELIRMATDDYLRSDDANEFEFTATLHAIHALGELRAEAAIEPLLSLLDSASEEGLDWIQETLINAYPYIGPVALPSLEQFLANPSHNDSAKNYVTGIIGRIAEEYPEAHMDCIAVVTRRLADFAVNDTTLNAFLITDLLQMKAVEAATLIQEAYANDCVDEAWCGDWTEVQYSLGLKERPPRKERRSIFPTLSTLTPTLSTPTPTRPTTSIATTPSHQSPKNPPASKKAKTKTKMAKASKRANRRKK